MMMDGRERFHRTMAYGQPDRVPFFEEGIRGDVLEAWRGQGMPENAAVGDLFPFDLREEIMPDMETRPYLENWPDSKSDLAELRRRLDPNDPGRLPGGWAESARAKRERGSIMMMRVHRGIFQAMGVADWKRFAELMHLFYDDPGLVHEIMEIQGEFAVGMVDRVLGEVEIDAAIFSETIAGNDGPLISPAMYEEFALHHYAPVVEAVRGHGVKTIIIRTYANTRVLLPCIMKYDFDCLWAVETNPEAMDYRSIRQEFGHELRLIGGIDAGILRQDEAAVAREIREIVPQLLQEGGYIPLADGRIRSGVTFEQYVAYRRILNEVVEKQGLGH